MVFWQAAESSTTNRLPLAVVSSGSQSKGYSESQGGQGVQGVQRLIVFVELLLLLLLVTKGLSSLQAMLSASSISD